MSRYLFIAKVVSKGGDGYTMFDPRLDFEGAMEAIRDDGGDPSLYHISVYELDSEAGRYWWLRDEEVL